MDLCQPSDSGHLVKKSLLEAARLKYLPLYFNFDQNIDNLI